MESWLQDVRYALRSLRRAPTFTLVSLVTIAFGVGANAAVFSVLNAIFLRTVPIEEPERVVAIYGTSRRDSSAAGFTQGLLPVSYPDFESVREQSETLQGTYAYGMWPVSVVTGEEPDRANVMVVSAEYFDVLGRPPALGGRGESVMGLVTASQGQMQGGLT